MPYEESPRLLNDSLEFTLGLPSKTLLEKKHLYQRIQVDFDTVHEAARRLDSETGLAVTAHADRVARSVNERWKGPVTRRDWVVLFRAPDVELFCVGCRRRQPYNPIYSEDILGHNSDDVTWTADGKSTSQVFVLSYLCQGCKRVPEVFVIHREGLRLSNTGRTPMEHVEVPLCISPDLGRFFTGAVVAHQSGHTLAGLFMVRTLIEQAARGTVGKDKIDELRRSSDGRTFPDRIMEAYMGSMHPAVRDEFPSMRSLYSAVSADLHEAVGDSGLFDRAIAEITEHFDARALFEKRARRG